MSASDLVLVLVTVLGLAFAIFLVVRHQRIRDRNRDLLVAGVPVRARVVRLRADEAEDSLLVATVEIDPASVPPGRPAPPPTAEIELFVPPLAQPSVQPGSSIALRYDPSATSRMVLDLAAMGFD